VIDVTDVRQVKGLEFDYVVMLDTNASSYGTDDRIPPSVPHRVTGRATSCGCW